MPILQSIIGGQVEGLPSALELVAGTLILTLVYYYFTGEKPYAGLPIVTLDGKAAGHFGASASDYIWNGRALFAKGLRECKSCFQIMTGSGYKIVVPNRFADELRSHPDLSFNEAFAKDFFIDYPGFDGHRQGLKDETFMQEVVRVKLTQSLGLVTDDLVEETDESLRDCLGESKEWKTFVIKENLLDIVARLSSRVFLGKELCRDEDWLKVSKNYTVDSFGAAQDLRTWSEPLRPLIYWFIPSCTRLRQEVRDARKLITEEFERRRKEAEESIQAGKKLPKTADAIGWMVEVAKGRPVDFVAGQLSLSLAAIHTTSETMSACVSALCKNPEVATPLREEIIRVLSTDGWSKTSLYKLRLMDSFLKEVQRSQGLAISSMNRLVKRPIELSDGTRLPKGGRIMVSDDKVNDPTIYENPEKFDAARFLRKREQPGEENRHQFVTTSGEHMGFGHGQHACPGRFFASNEIKIALCFWLLKYDTRYVPDEEPMERIAFESASMTHPMFKVQLRRREEEIDLLSPKAS